MDVREKLVELIFESLCRHVDKSCKLEENIADDLISSGITVKENMEISDELLKQLKNAPITICKEEPLIETVQEWISIDERLPKNFVSVLGYMTDAGEFHPVRECYTVGNAFFFPALGDIHPVSHWCEMPEPPKGE